MSYVPANGYERENFIIKATAALGTLVHQSGGPITIKKEDYDKAFLDSRTILRITHNDDTIRVELAESEGQREGVIYRADTGS